MKNTYRLYQRSNTFYCQNNTTGKQESLGTTNKEEAERILHAKNESARDQTLNRALAEVYLRATDPLAGTRTWKDVMDEGTKGKSGPTLTRWNWAMASKSFDGIRNLKLIETRAERFIEVLANGKVSTNVFLRRLHNLAMDLDWLSRPILPKKRWPKVKYGAKRAVTAEEHQKILAGEQNPEWRAFYTLVWHLGGSQTDIARLSAENVNWPEKVVSYRRCKSDEPARLRFGDDVASVLRALPRSGLLLPAIAAMNESDRGIAFTRRCKLVGVSGVTLHCYRYAWAERARNVCYPERAAREALGQQSQAVHRAYAKSAQPNVPDLETFEKMSGRVIDVEFSPPAKSRR